AVVAIEEAVPQPGRRVPAGSRQHSSGFLDRRDLLERDIGVRQQLLDGVQLVRLLVEDPLDAGIDEHLEAVDARRVRDVDAGVADAGAVLRRLRDRVDLGVDAAEAVLLDLAARSGGAIDETPDVEAVRQARRRSVVARREDVLVTHDDGAHLRAQAGRALGDLPGDREEVLVPGRSRAHDTILMGSGTKVTRKRIMLATAPRRRAGPSGRASLVGRGWPMSSIAAATPLQTSQKAERVAPSQTSTASSTAGSSVWPRPRAA